MCSHLCLFFRDSLAGSQFSAGKCCLLVSYLSLPCCSSFLLWSLLPMWMTCLACMDAGDQDHRKGGWTRETWDDLCWGLFPPVSSLNSNVYDIPKYCTLWSCPVYILSPNMSAGSEPWANHSVLGTLLPKHGKVLPLSLGTKVFPPRTWPGQVCTFKVFRINLGPELPRNSSPGKGVFPCLRVQAMLHRIHKMGLTMDDCACPKS